MGKSKDKKCKKKKAKEIVEVTGYKAPDGVIYETRKEACQAMARDDYEDNLLELFYDYLGIDEEEDDDVDCVSCDLLAGVVDFLLDKPEKVINILSEYQSIGDVPAGN